MLGLTVLMHSHQLWPGQPPLGLWVKDPSNFGICGLAVTALNTTDSPTSFWKGQGHIDFGWFWMILGFKISLLRIKESKVCLSRMLHVWLEFWGKASCLIREACWNSTCLWHNAMFTGFFKFWCFLFYLLWLQFTDEKTAEPDARRILVDNFAILPFSQSSCLKVSCLCHWKASSHLKSTLIPHSCRWNSIFWGGKIHIFRWKPYFLLVKQKKYIFFGASNQAPPRLAWDLAVMPFPSFPYGNVYENIIITNHSISCLTWRCVSQWLPAIFAW